MKEKPLKSKLKFSAAVMLFLFSSFCVTAQTITGTVTSSAQPLAGASIIEKGTTNGVQSDFDGNFTISNTSENAILIISYVGYITKEIAVNGKSTISISLEEDVSSLDEVVIVGYGTTKKVNLTGAISVVGEEVFKDRPVGNVTQALQGASPNLQITTSNGTGEPGAGMNINIRGMGSFNGGSSPYVLIDGIPMDINAIDPNDIKTVSVLKDVAATAIYGARAAFGVILITTKSGNRKGKISVSYSTNYAVTTPLNMADNADALSFAHTMNDASTNQGNQPYYTEQRLEWIAQNLANPGSATEVEPSANGKSWNLGVDGLNASAATDWQALLIKKTSSRIKHNLNVSGGSKDVSYYVSGGYYNEDGLLKQADDFYKRYNVDAKIDATIAPWMNFSLYTKYKLEKYGYPSSSTADSGRSFVMLLMTRLKPTKPAFYPGTDIWTGRIEEQSLQTTKQTQRQLVLSPRLRLEPIKNWVTNIELNYRRNDNDKQAAFLTIPSAVPDGLGGSTVVYSSQEKTSYYSQIAGNTYLSPNIYTDYTKGIGNHNFHVLAGYQQETYSSNGLTGNAAYLLSDAIPSINTAVGDKTVFDARDEWSTQGVYARFNYNFSEKYLLELNVRKDGSSRFKSGERWGTFPSAALGWNVSKENFFPFKEQIKLLKFRASYGTIGNQNVGNNLYSPNLPVSQTSWLFNDDKAWSVGTPNLSSIDLTWEKVTTLDFGVDILALNNRLNVTFDWYEARIWDLSTAGLVVPATLGASAPYKNNGEITTRGWEFEIGWQNSSNDFSYGFTAALSDYTKTITQFDNDTKILSKRFEGQTMNSIWGYETAGLFQSEDDIANWGVDQSFLYGANNWKPGDVKYVDIDGDGEITNGNNTLGDSGDKKIIGNSTPRYQFGFTGNASWKGFDISFLIQGVAKRDLDLRGLGTFRGPANGPLHANVYTEHLDYWRDDTSGLGANPDAYFARPYAAFTGENNKNYGVATTGYLQNGAYVRLKNAQIGYTVPATAKMPKFRIYLSGENLLTFTDLMIYDPEAFSGRNSRTGDAYPISQVFSLGLNINL